MGKIDIPDNIVFVCTGSKCAKRGGKDCYKSLKSYLKENKKKNEIELIRIECTDRCKIAPVLNLQPQNMWLTEYKLKDVFKAIDDIL